MNLELGMNLNLGHVKCFSRQKPLQYTYKALNERKNSNWIVTKNLTLKQSFCTCPHNTRSLLTSTTLHSVHVFRREIDPHSNVFKTNESKTQNKPETLVSHTLSGLRNKNSHEEKNEQLPHWEMMLRRHCASTERKLCSDDS